MSERSPDEILEYCEKATAGPWVVFIEERESDINSILPAGRPGSITTDLCTDNAWFVANARTDLPRMAKRVKELEGLLATKRKQLRETDTELDEVRDERDKMEATLGRYSQHGEELKALCREAESLLELELAFHDTHTENCNMCVKIADMIERLREAGGESDG